MPITYEGPIPPTPGEPFDAAKWQIYQTYQTLLQNLRYENEREAALVLAAVRALVTDKQHTDRTAAETACAAANAQLAEAHQAMAAALRHVADTPQQLLLPEVVKIALQGAILAPAPPPDPAIPPATTGLVAETIVLARKWAGVYSAPTTSP
jgi:hypothetical protein